MKRTANLIVQHLLWRGLYFFSVLVLNILIARFFAAEKSGQIFYIVNNLSFALLLVSMSLESAAVYFIASGKLDGLQMARFSVLWILLAGAVAASGWWLSLRFTRSAYAGNPAFLGISLLFISGALMTTFFSALFYAKKEFGLPNKLLGLVNGALIILLILGNQAGWSRSDFLFLYFFSYFLQGLVLMIAFFIWYPGKREKGFPHAPVLKEMARYSLSALSANVIYFLVNRMDYWFVKHYCSALDLGNYIQASKLAQILLIVPSILGASIFPLIASGKEKTKPINLARVIRILFWINMAICLPILLTGYRAFPWLFGQSFAGMYLLFMLLMPGLLCLTANYPLTAWNSGRNRIKRNIGGSILALVFIATGDFLILPRVGVPAAAVVSSIGHFCYFAYNLFYYQREQPSAWGNFFAFRKSDFSWLLLQARQLPLKNAQTEEINLR